MEPTGYYGAEYMSAIYGADFCRTYTEPIPWSDIYEAGQTHMNLLRDMWNYRRYKVNCSLYRKRKGTRDACMHA